MTICEASPRKVSLFCGSVLPFFVEVFVVFGFEDFLVLRTGGSVAK